MRFRFNAVAAGLVAAATSSALAQAPTSALPNKTVQVVVPNAPGAGNDLIARLIAPKLSETIKQSVVVENRPSANGIVGTEVVARATPDGSVLGVGNAGTHAVNASLYKKLPYDPVRDFAAITELATTSLVIVSNPVVPAKSVKELIAIARKSPGKLNAAIAGATGEIATNALKLQAKVDIKNIPYKGGAPSLVAIVSGESDFTMTNYAAVATLAQAGKLRVLAVLSKRNSSSMPEVPTIAAAGFPGMDGDGWVGVLVPAGTPKEIVALLNKQINEAMALPELKEKFSAAGLDTIGGSPEDFANIMRTEGERWAKVIKAANVKAK